MVLDFLMPAPIQSPPKGGMDIAPSVPARAMVLSRPEGRAPGRPSYPGQLTLVMVQPQRGHSDPWPDRQVVPQLEQVDAVAGLPEATQPQA